MVGSDQRGSETHLAETAHAANHLKLEKSPGNTVLCVCPALKYLFIPATVRKRELSQKDHSFVSVESSLYQLVPQKEDPETN